MTPETTRRMAGGALAVSAFSVALALFAYWRTGGSQDAERAHAVLRADIDSLREKQTEAVAYTRASLDAAYQTSHDRLTRLRELLRTEKDRAEADARAQLERAEADAHALVTMVEAEARMARDASIGTAEQAERALSSRVRALESRVALLRAKQEVRRAATLADNGKVEAAAGMLVAVADRLDEAQARMPREHEVALSSVRAALQAALTSVQAQASERGERIEALLSRTDALVRSLEESEDTAAGRAGTPGRKAS
ncbi:hypothetical protein [Nannocystis bainbridge]|uniref:Chromosome partition protein Smc n=1 Tax=Nannocystis bainbridge TaxID=2995303 RepID=A0ABT5EDV2_9BACT|nr:hypothetical protein [Nannocystis bainbridge]MDC0723108.1 hypothetical protein [Nannocystis bainbridge]